MQLTALALLLIAGKEKKRKKRNVKKAFTKRVATLLVILMMAQTMFIPGFAVTSVFAQDTPNETVTEEAQQAEKRLPE